jgi:Ca2+-binding EF-hand superfamily protein
VLVNNPSEINDKTKTWNKDKYMENIWNGIIHRDSAKLSESELNQALENGFPNSQFKRDKLKKVFTKYDKNKDKQIDFDEFSCLFAEINEKFHEFLVDDSDKDYSVNNSASIILPITEKNERNSSDVGEDEFR